MAECAALGTGTVPEVIREGDPNVLLALTAVNKQMVELREAQQRRLAQHIVAELMKAWK